MPDILDAVQDNLDRAYSESEKRRGVYVLPKGEPGTCDECGQHKPRLVNHLCGRCRDDLRIVSP